MEAARWIALGRLPHEIWDSVNVGDGSFDFVEHRRNEAEVWDGEFYEEIDYILSSEFSAMDIEVDYRRYEAAASGRKWMTGQQLIDEVDERILRFSRILEAAKREVTPEVHAHNDSERATARKDASELDWARRTDEPFEALKFLGQAKLFEALLTGKIKSEGFALFTEQEMEINSGDGPRNGVPGEFIEIPPSEWVSNSINWHNSSLNRPKRTYKAAQVNTEDIIKCFPNPLIPPARHEGLSFGETFISSSKGEPHESTARSRGRPKKSDGNLEKFLLHEFVRRRDAGELPSKREAIYQAAMEWAEAVAGIPLSRTAAQKYLRPLWD